MDHVPSGLHSLATRALGMLVAGDEEPFPSLRTQLETATVASCETTGVGFFLTFESSQHRCPVTPPNFALSDVFADFAGIEAPVNFVLFVREGQLAVLEGYSMNSEFPSTEAKLVRMYYVKRVPPGTLLSSDERDYEFVKQMLHGEE